MDIYSIASVVNRPKFLPQNEKIVALEKISAYEKICG
jgi:hypothetical protein